MGTRSRGPTETRAHGRRPPSPIDAIHSEGKVLAEKATTASSEIYSAPSSMGTRPGKPKVLAELEEEETTGTMIASSLCN